MEHRLQEAAKALPEATLQFEKIEAQETIRTHRSWQKAVVMAASFVLALCLGLGCFAISVEAKEYRAAVAFFDANDLSTEGLDRAEIKAVYRDITTKCFAYEKTAQVLISTGRVEGYEINQPTPPSEELAGIWHQLTQLPATEHYRIDSFDDGYALTKCAGEKVLWRVDCSEFMLPNMKQLSDCIIIYGQHRDSRNSLLYKIDYDGKLLWSDHVDNGFQKEEIRDIVELEGGYALISSAYSDESYLCMSLYTQNGQRTLYQTNAVKGTALIAAGLGDGFMVYMGTEQVIRLDGQGKVVSSIAYDSDTYTYRIQDMIEFCGKVYISAYAVAKGDDEIANILKYVHSQKGDYTDEELCAVVRDNYTAVLLVCDPDSGVPQEFYSVSGARGGTLSLGADGNLTWNVETVIGAAYSPYTSAYRLIGTCRTYQYFFQTDATLIGYVKTERVTGFTR